MGVKFERQALDAPASRALLLILFGAAALCVRLGTMALAREDEPELQFEEEATPAVMELGLRRDGVTPIEPRPEGPPES